VRWYATHRLAEVAFHGWDLRTSLGREPVFSVEVARLLLPTLIESNVPRTYAAGLSQERGSGERYALLVADHPEDAWLVTIGPAELQVSRGAEGAPERTQEENGSAESRSLAPEAQRLRPRTPPVPSRPIASRSEILEEPRPIELEPLPPAREEDDFEEVGRPEGPSGDRFSWPDTLAPRLEPAHEERAPVFEPAEETAVWEPEPVAEEESAHEPEPPTPAPTLSREPVSERAVTPSPAPAATPPASPPAPAFGRRPGRVKR